MSRATRKRWYNSSSIRALQELMNWKHRHITVVTDKAGRNQVNRGALTQSSMVLSKPCSEDPDGLESRIVHGLRPTCTVCCYEDDNGGGGYEDDDDSPSCHTTLRVYIHGYL